MPKQSPLTDPDPAYVLLIAPPSSYRIVPYLQAAARLGLKPWLVSQGEYSLIGAAVEGLRVDLAQPERALDTIVQTVAPHPVHGVLGTDDRTVPLAAQVARTLGLRHNPPEAAELSRRKDRARERLHAAGLPVPLHRRVDIERPVAPQLHGVGFPCVVKPLSLSGSRGVIRADTPAELHTAVDRVARLLGREQTLPAEERQSVLVEQFVPGPEVALEGMLEDGELEVLALFDKPDPLEGPYFEETYYVTPSRHPWALQDCARRRVSEACAAYGLRHGPVHAELRLWQGDAWIMEVAARTIGGECARLLQLGSGRGLEDLVLARAVARPLKLARDSGAAGVLMIPIPRAGLLRRVEGLGAARRVPFVEEVTISVREGYELVPLPEGESYLGFVHARAPTPGQAETALREAHAHLNFVTAPVLASGDWTRAPQ